MPPILTERRPALQSKGTGLSSEFVATAARLGFNLTQHTFGFSVEPIRGGADRHFASEAEVLGFFAEKRRENAQMASPAA
jgi:hypothetical protein